MLRVLFLSLLALFLAAPLVVVAGVSFNQGQTMVFPPVGLSLRWYEEFFTNPSWTASFERSLGIAAATSVLATTIALPVAYVQWKHGSRLARMLGLLGAVPFLLPPVIVSILFVLFWGTLKHVGQIENIVISHTVTFLALPLILVSLGFSTVEREMVEAAETMGARAGDVWHTVVLPIIMPFIVSGMIFTAILSLNEYIIAYMVAGFTMETLPVKVFSNMRTGFTPAMCVGAVMFLIVGVSGFLLVARLGNLPKLLGGKA